MSYSELPILVARIDTLAIQAETPVHEDPVTEANGDEDSTLTTIITVLQLMSHYELNNRVHIGNMRQRVL